MSQSWKVDGPRTIDVGDEGEVVRGLRADIVAGSLNVVTHDEDVAVVEVHEVTGEPLEVEWDGSTVQLRQKQPRSALGWISRKAIRTSARVTVTLPRTADIDVDSVSADLLVDNLTGDVTRDAVSGATTLRRVRGTIHVNAVSGVVTAMGTDGELHVDTVSGTVTLSEVRSTLIDLDSVSGSLVADLATVDEPCRVDIDGVSASVHLRIPDVPLAVSCDSLGGTVTVDGQERPRQQRSFAEAGALVRVRLDGVSSSAVVVRKDAS